MWKKVLSIMCLLCVCCVFVESQNSRRLPGDIWNSWDDGIKTFWMDGFMSALGLAVDVGSETCDIHDKEEKASNYKGTKDFHRFQALGLRVFIAE